jgi:hypothetical protein
MGGGLSGPCSVRDGIVEMDLGLALIQCIVSQEALNYYQSGDLTRRGPMLQ